MADPMPSPEPEMHAKVDQLLHDAENAESGARMAAIMNDRAAVARLHAKKMNLIAEANVLDPNHAAPAWSEADV
jgi:hypothetical protein